MTDGEIVAALDSGEITITPIGSRNEQIQPCSVDLRLSREVMKYKHKLRGIDTLPTIRLGESLHNEMEKIDLGARPVFPLGPNEFALGVTMERVKLPPHILGRVEGRSSIGRAGLFVHITAGFIDPGFDGRITLEFYNGSPRVIEIPFGFRVCQLALQRLARACERPYGVERGSKYVGRASESVEPAGAERESAPEPPRVIPLSEHLATANPPDEIDHPCLAPGCGGERAKYVYDWHAGRGHYECTKCGTRSEERRWTTAR